jgi:hypothetical protein
MGSAADIMGEGQRDDRKEWIGLQDASKLLALWMKHGNMQGTQYPSPPHKHTGYR